MGDSLNFFRSFLRNPTHVGAVWPSSRSLSRALVGHLPLKAGDVVVEYGPGTGPVTQILEETLPPGVEYLGIELNAEFVQVLRRRFPQRRFHHGSVADVEQVLTDAGLPKPKLIISGLPFASLPVNERKKIIDSTAKVLQPGGQFRTFQYLHAYPLPKASKFRKSMVGGFGPLSLTGPVLCNLPPAFVLSYSAKG